MGRYNFAAQRVHQATTRLLASRLPIRTPPWLKVIGDLPPSERLTRPPLRPGGRATKKASKMFQPQRISYPEDKLRFEFFGDHPWELARPRIILEDDGKDYQKYDWSRIEQPGKKLDGESVVQRQRWLMVNQRLPQAEAYDKARKEFYKLRHREDIQRRVAKEEALMVGAKFGPGPVEIGMQLEDEAYEAWREWANKEVETLKQMSASAGTGLDEEDAVFSSNDPGAEDALNEVGADLPKSKQGQEALGGAIVHP